MEATKAIPLPITKYVNIEYIPLCSCIEIDTRDFAFIIPLAIKSQIEVIVILELDPIETLEYLWRRYEHKSSDKLSILESIGTIYKACFELWKPQKQY